MTSSYPKIITQFAKKHLLVVGDVMLDQYIRGSVSRISPEAPVPVVLEKESFYTPGGAANVAQNLKSLGARVTLIGRVGKDLEGEILKKELKKKNIPVEGIFVDPRLPTISKTRVLAQHQQVVRIDKEDSRTKPSDAVIKKMFHLTEKIINRCDGVIISDYGKGLITPELVSFICDLTQKRKKIITVDPKVEHFSYYRRVTAITPNLKETENAIRDIKIKSNSGHELGLNNDRLHTNTDIDQAGHRLLEYLDLDCLLITLGERGMRLFERQKKPIHIETQAQEVYDVTGAGDAVISVFTLSLASGATKYQAADLANRAAGIVVGKLGAVAVTKEELLKKI